MTDVTSPLLLRDVLKLHEGLARLEGATDKDGRTAPYDFDAATVWDITVNLVVAESATGTYERARTTLGKTHGVVAGMAVTDVNAPAVAAFIAADEELKAKPSVALTAFKRFSRTALQKAGVKNPAVLAKLYPIIDDK